MKSGIDPSAVDPNVRPQDDLFAHINGLWIRATPIPADRGRYGTFDVLRWPTQVAGTGMSKAKRNGERKLRRISK